jgi:putative aminopeptidase FrvX
MQHDPELLEALRTDLEELTALHAPSGCEQPVIARLRELFTPFVDGVTIDHMGNLTATRQGPPGAPHVVVSAHADEIGALVASIEPEGFLRLMPIGGIQPRLLEGRAVWVGGHIGVIGARSGHLMPHSEHGPALSVADLYVDLGVDTAAEVGALGVRVGDPVVVLSELRRLSGTRVAGKLRAPPAPLTSFARACAALSSDRTGDGSGRSRPAWSKGGLCAPASGSGHHRGYVSCGRDP